VKIKAKAKYVLLFLISHLLIYSLVQKIYQRNEYDFYTVIDALFPFIPEFIWIYHTLIPVVLFTTIILIKRKDCFFSSYIACLLATISLTMFYFIFPSYYPRGGLIEEITISEWLVNWTRMIDDANNTFPSSHVTFSWIMFLSVINCDIAKKYSFLNTFYAFWAILVSVSTLLLKQHFIIDVGSGIILASICYYIAKKISNSLYVRQNML
jgi:membrane-associated phospholipid phosphatase